MTDAENQIVPMVETFAARDMNLSGQISQFNDTLQDFHKTIVALRESIDSGLLQVKDEVKRVDSGLRQTIKDEVEKVDSGLRQKITQIKDTVVQSAAETLKVLANTSLDMEGRLTARIVRLEKHVDLSNEADTLNAEIGNSPRNV